MIDERTPLRGYRLETKEGKGIRGEVATLWGRAFGPLRRMVGTSCFFGNVILSGE